ncbi:WYL domain-containing protein [Vibrio anguillarum]|uniref:WYL domain-containing protein n=1 Tax=Vibrio anguillarum TaxID=55601 RepID=UPI0035947025
MPLLTSKLDAETINVIYKAVLEEKCIRLVYRSMSSEKEQRVLFHSYGIVVRGERNYLVGKFADTVMFASYRSTACSVLNLLTSQRLLTKTSRWRNTSSRGKWGLSAV